MSDNFSICPILSFSLYSIGNASGRFFAYGSP
jgi:hypothetical protein